MRYLRAACLIKAVNGVLRRANRLFCCQTRGNALLTRFSIERDKLIRQNQKRAGMHVKRSICIGGINEE